MRQYREGIWIDEEISYHRRPLDKGDVDLNGPNIGGGQ